MSAFLMALAAELRAEVAFLRAEIGKLSSSLLAAEARNAELESSLSGERERCAALADKEADRHNIEGGDLLSFMTAQSIADDIRTKEAEGRGGAAFFDKQGKAMTRRLGSEWSNPIWHGKWRIWGSGDNWQYCHDSYDGDEEDRRHGFASSVEQAKAEIDEGWPK